MRNQNVVFSPSAYIAHLLTRFKQTLWIRLQMAVFLVLLQMLLFLLASEKAVDKVADCFVLVPLPLLSIFQFYSEERCE